MIGRYLFLGIQRLYWWQWGLCLCSIALYFVYSIYILQTVTLLNIEVKFRLHSFCFLDVFNCIIFHGKVYLIMTIPATSYIQNLCNKDSIGIELEVEE